MQSSWTTDMNSLHNVRQESLVNIPIDFEDFIASFFLKCIILWCFHRLEL